jgi:pyruvate formate lyase activating enzyme
MGKTETLNSLIFDIRRYTIHDGPGIRTTVFFKGCPLRCIWCHNPESQEACVEQVTVQRTLDGKLFESELAVGRWQSAVDVMKEVEKDEVFYLESGGGVTFSGGEPLMQADALAEILALCKEKGYHTAIDTSGHADAASIKKVMDLGDLWLFDLKLMNDSRHVEYTGVSNEMALNNLEMLAREGKQIIIRFPLVPGITDDPENLHSIATTMANYDLDRIDILPYHDIAREKYRRIGKVNFAEWVKEPETEKVDEVLNFFSRKGFKAEKG